LVDSGQTFSVIHPGTGAVCAPCVEATRADLDHAVASARAAQLAWGATPPAERRAALLQLAAVIRTHQDELTGLITLEQGKPLAAARMEVGRAAMLVEQFVQMEIAPESLRDDATGRVEVHYRPLGVVGAITPWNMPLVLSVPKIAHALYAGNTVVLKPSPYTPLTMLRLAEYARTLFPAGVLNVLAGGNALGQGLPTGAVPPQQGDRKAAAGIEHHYGRIALFALQPGRHQTGDGAAGPHGHQGLAVGPGLLQKKGEFVGAPGLAIGRQGHPFNQAGAEQALQQGVGLGAEAKPPDQLFVHPPSLSRRPARGPRDLGCSRDPSART
jgi:hypothetical protein